MLVNWPKVRKNQFKDRILGGIGWDKKEFLRPLPLLERNIQDKGWKSVMHLSHEKWCVVSR
jgi:hypothetical protein